MLHTTMFNNKLKHNHKINRKQLIIKIKIIAEPSLLPLIEHECVRVGIRGCSRFGVVVAS